MSWYERDINWWLCPITCKWGVLVALITGAPHCIYQANTHGTPCILLSLYRDAILHYTVTCNPYIVLIPVLVVLYNSSNKSLCCNTAWYLIWVGLVCTQWPLNPNPVWYTMELLWLYLSHCGPCVGHSMPHPAQWLVNKGPFVYHLLVMLWLHSLSDHQKSLITQCPCICM